MPDTNPFAKFLPQSPPPDPLTTATRSAVTAAQGAATGSQPSPLPDDTADALTLHLGHYGEDWNEQIQAGKQAIGDWWRRHSTLDPSTLSVQDRSQLATEQVVPGANAAPFVQYASAPINAAFNTVFGRPVEHVTGGAVSRQTAGLWASYLVPFAGELGGALGLDRAAMALSREANIPVSAARAVLTEARPPPVPRTTATHAANQAAGRLLGKGIELRGTGRRLNPTQVRANVAERAHVGAPPGTLLGNMNRTAQRVVRTAGTRMGEADETLTAHQQATRADVSAQGVQRTEQLGQENAPQGAGQSIPQRIEALTAQRDGLASTQFRGPYSEPVQVSDDVLTVLDQPSGVRALREAKLTAGERGVHDPEAAQQQTEMTALQAYGQRRAKWEQEHEAWVRDSSGSFAVEPAGTLREMLDNPTTPPAVRYRIMQEHGWHKAPEPQPPTAPTVSAGTLDRIRLQLDRSGRAMQQNPNTYARGGALIQHAGAIDAYLDGLPNLQEARAAYRDFSTRIEQLEFDQNLSTMRPEQFRQIVDGLSPAQRQELAHSVTERLATQLGKSSGGEQAQSNVMTTGYNFRQNLESLVGKEQADRYIRAMEIIQRDVRAAHAAASGTGSQTVGRALDVAETSANVLVNIFSGRWHAAGHQIFRFAMKHFSGMSEAEAQQIAQWAVSQDDVEGTLKAIEAAARSTPRNRAAALDAFPADIRKIVDAYLISRPPPLARRQQPAQQPAGTPAVPAQPQAQQPTAPPPADSNNVFERMLNDPNYTPPADQNAAPAPASQPAASPQNLPQGIAPYSASDAAVNKLLTIINHDEGSPGPMQGVGYANLQGSQTDQYGFPQWQGHSSPIPGKLSHGAGSFQFEPGTWDKIAKQYGLDFQNPEAQRAGAWYLAQEIYQQRTGRSLKEALDAGDIDSVRDALAGTWNTRPGTGVSAGRPTFGGSIAPQSEPDWSAFAPQPVQ